MMSAMSVPYDSKVEYLESPNDGVGTSVYIDTGIIGDETCAFEIKFTYYKAQAVFGSRSTNSNAIIVASDRARMGSTMAYLVLTNGTTYTVTLDKNAYVINGTSYQLGASAFTTNNSVCIFSANSVSVSRMVGRIYYFKMWKNGELVRDFIPVRVGQVGYMYDKVSGVLFGNAGSGAFILGNDI